MKDQVVALGIGFVLGLATAAVLILVVQPVHGAEVCIPIDVAIAAMKENGFEVLGVRRVPFSGTAIFYRVDDEIYLAPIEGACVSPLGSYSGHVVPETNV